MRLSNKLIIGGFILLWIGAMLLVALFPTIAPYLTGNEITLAAIYSGSPCLAGVATVIIFLGALLALVLNNPFDLNF